MQTLLKIGEKIDTINRGTAIVCDWMVLLGVLVSAINASVRYLFDSSSNAWLELQWFTFAIMFLLGASYTLRMNEHVRVDIFYSSVSDRARLWIDTFGIIFFLLPATSILTYLCWRYFHASFKDMEISGNAGGLPFWPIKFFMPLGFFLLTLQGISELIKRVAALRGLVEFDAHYEKPLQ
jgi:TRAP-type mannitol/chloroaromatic compound transport system permease small subunit